MRINLRNWVARLWTKRPARPPRRGWTPWEPGVLAFALFLFVASGVMSWWGTMQDSSRFSYISRRGLDLAPFTAETWEFFFFPETLYRTGEAFSWWDFASRHPEFAGYGIVAVVWMSLWLATLLLASFAFLARAVPRSRMRGLPTRLQGSAATALLTAVAVVIFALPSAIGVAGFTGAEGKLAWGPRLGFFLAVAASGLMGLASVLGLRVDRNLRGVCWRCFHAATGNRCEYCGVRL